MAGCLRTAGPWAEPGLEVVLAAQVPLAELPQPEAGDCPVPAVQPGGPDRAPVPQVQSVVCVDSERSAFQEVVEMFDSQVDAKEFFVESGMNSFRLAQLATEKGERPPILSGLLFQDSSNGGVGSVSG